MFPKKYILNIIAYADMPLVNIVVLSFISTTTSTTTHMHKPIGIKDQDNNL